MCLHAYGSVYDLTLPGRVTCMLAFHICYGHHNLHDTTDSTNILLLLPARHTSRGRLQDILLVQRQQEMFKVALQVIELPIKHPELFEAHGVAQPKVSHSWLLHMLAELACAISHECQCHSEPRCLSRHVLFHSEGMPLLNSFQQVQLSDHGPSSALQSSIL